MAIRTKICLREIAEAQELTMQAIANKTGIAYSTVVDLWHDRTKRIDKTTLDKLCDALSVEPGDILVRKERKQRSEETTLGLISRFKVLLAEKEIREKRSITLRDVVKETGISIYTVTGFANNTLREIPTESLLQLCQYFEASVGDILEINE